MYIGDSRELDIIIPIINNKYTTTISKDDILCIEKYTDIIRMKIDVAVILDVYTYKLVKSFNIKKILCHSSDEHNYLNDKKTTFYGWYYYQPHHIKNRLKLYKDIHKTYKLKGNKVLLSSPQGNIYSIIDELDIDRDTLLIKTNSGSFYNLFEQISKVIYYRGIRDTDNRIIVECGIHNIDLEVHLKGILDDSIKDRSDLFYQGKLNELYLDKDDLIVKDYLKEL